MEKQYNVWPPEIVDGTIDQLGEFDFGQGSGWMYSINDSYPNVGFSDTYMFDGAVMKVRYTLWYGKDIGGAGSMGQWPGREDVEGGNWTPGW